MVDVETLKEAIFTWHQATNTERDDLVVFAAAREHVACLEGPTAEDVEVGAEAIAKLTEQAGQGGTLSTQALSNAVLVAVAEARRKS